MSEFLHNCGDLLAVLTVVMGGLGVAAWLLERRARRREPEVLPPPIDGRDHNAESIAEWQRKRAAMERSE